jgi:S-adenosylmethionine:diacylglycerol 3-amino-3-carboxypropyl transferase
VCCTRRRFYQSGLDIGQVLELEHKIRRIFGILCKDSINHNAMGNEILTEQPLAPTAVVAAAT